MKTDFRNVNEFIGWDKAEEFVKQIIKENSIKTILELGAGANPTINPMYIATNKLSYTITDNNLDELTKADNIYAKEELDLNIETISHHKKYDLIFSRMVGEHIQNGSYFHQNIYSLLNSGGIAFHCFSTLYSLPFLINRLFPETVSDALLKMFAPRDKHKHGKFRAYYSWCRGPSVKMIERYEKIGYNIVEYIGYYGHNYYRNISLLNELEKIKTKMLIKNKITYLTSYAHIILKK
jgi:2-polyprenyl-3-methyl-5-hydroxy-6-metoxy-1,4-benzoquinol methylase